MHNGVISDFIPIRRALAAKLSDETFSNVHGSTDSEHIAALYMTYLTRSSSDTASFEQEYSLPVMADAMHKAVATVLNLQRTIIGDAKRKPNSLNLCATDGVKVVAYRFRNHATSQPPSLYYSTKAGTTLNRKYPDHPDGPTQKDAERLKREGEHGRHLVSLVILRVNRYLSKTCPQLIASEPSTYKISDWELIGKNQSVTAGADGTIQVRDIPYEQAWDAEDG